MYSIGGSSCNKNSASCEISAKKMLPGFVRKTFPIGNIAFSDSNCINLYISGLLFSSCCGHGCSVPQEVSPSRMTGPGNFTASQPGCTRMVF